MYGMHLATAVETLEACETSATEIFGSASIQVPEDEGQLTGRSRSRRLHHHHAWSSPQLGAVILIRTLQLSLQIRRAYRLLSDSATSILSSWKLHLLGLRLLDFLSRHFEDLYIPKRM
jgi:hypothetical protein